jgi:type IV secretory pathway TrbF-like protein
MKLDLREKVFEVRAKMVNGMSYEDAKSELQPYIDEINKIGKQIARKHKKKYYDLTFGYLVR